MGGAFKYPVGEIDPFYIILQLFFPLEFAAFGAQQALKNCVKWGIDL